MLLVAALTTSPSQAQNCQLQQYGFVEMHVVDGQVALPLAFGSEQRDFEFSLSGGDNRMSQTLAEELKLPFHKLPYPFVRSKYYSGAVTVPQLRIGNVSMKDVDFMVFTPAAEAEGTNNAVGMRVFGKVDLDLDMGARKLSFFSQDHCPGRAVYWTKEFAQVPFELETFGFVRPQLKLDGKPVTVALTLNFSSAITLGTMFNLFGVDVKSPQVTLAETSADGKKFYHYPFKSLGTDELKINNPAIRVLEGTENTCKRETAHSAADFAYQHNTDVRSLGGDFCYGGADLTLGYSVLSKLHMYFSLKEKILYLSAADAH